MGRSPAGKNIQEVLRRARASTTLELSEVPYKVYTNFPKLLNRLWKILKVIWRRGKVADPWRLTEGVWIPKEEKSKNIEQF